MVILFGDVAASPSFLVLAVCYQQCIHIPKIHTPVLGSQVAERGRRPGDFLCPMRRMKSVAILRQCCSFYLADCGGLPGRCGVQDSAVRDRNLAVRGRDSPWMAAASPKHLCWRGVRFCPPFCGQCCCLFWTSSVSNRGTFSQHFSFWQLAELFEPISPGWAISDVLFNCTRSGVPRPFSVSSEDAVFLR